MNSGTVIGFIATAAGLLIMLGSSLRQLSRVRGIEPPDQGEQSP